MFGVEEDLIRQNFPRSSLKICDNEGEWHVDFVLKTNGYYYTLLHMKHMWQATGEANKQQVDFCFKTSGRSLESNAPDSSESKCLIIRNKYGKTEFQDLTHRSFLPTLIATLPHLTRSGIDHFQRPPHLSSDLDLCKDI